MNAICDIFQVLIKFNLCNNFLIVAAVFAQRHKNKPQRDRSRNEQPLDETSSVNVLTAWDSCSLLSLTGVGRRPRRLQVGDQTGATLWKFVRIFNSTCS